MILGCGWRFGRRTALALAFGNCAIAAGLRADRNAPGEEARAKIEAAAATKVKFDLEDNPGEMRGLATMPLALVRNLANKRLDAHTTTRCQISPEAYLGRPARINHVITPRNLLGAIWAQFMRAVEGHAHFRNCEQCGGPFEVSGRKYNGKRSDARYCGSTCKVAAHRRRHGKTKRTHPRRARTRKLARTETKARSPQKPRDKAQA